MQSAGFFVIPRQHNLTPPVKPTIDRISKMTFYDVVIVGAGPAGLACAKVTAENGARTLVIERKNRIGYKVCAGGITWNGLINKLNDISEKSFTRQYIFSKYQQLTITEKNPIIATVNRETLGQLMLENALRAGAHIKSNWQVTTISDRTVTMVDRSSRTSEVITYGTLVGADGSSSVVRKHLGYPVRDFGVGINYMVEGNFSKMEWHLNSSLFGSGYAWIFPHNNRASIGAYADSKSVGALFLKKSLMRWATAQKLCLPAKGLTAERINYDFVGYQFGNTFLVGDAAGLASALTGEGIYPAMVSGEAVGKEIVYNKKRDPELDKLIVNHKKHRIMAKIARSHPRMSTCLSELICYGLKKNIINFSAAEMAHSSS
ncbi:NAD(P)/FAD-dependent oxidoreductase [Desulforhopalus sp. IMCC35007]|uniref:NAD(P)/FAD-dependent oxidoreductase n=1 Tax=Desulforhopalus sp. IMCC35007 TaxID=2569543 RepID=UPI00211059C9|nr:NAD(P)/FAD-dependent oxidoreductase [Desulforhopalus sp. IMCC35007]